MVCDASMCLPPEEIPIAISASDIQPESERPNYCPEPQHWCDHTAKTAVAKRQARKACLAKVETLLKARRKAKKDSFGRSCWGLDWAWPRLLTPCVFPMIPMTVSFFTKQSKTRAEGIRNALIYGFFIIFIYTALGLALTAFFGVDVLNVISTDPIFNVFLFLLLLVFGASFLGAFEIQLPSSWANKADAASDRGGIIGIFFMAATLAIVSFSCTGPLVGSALAGAATGSFAAPTAVMLGFSSAWPCRLACSQPSLVG